jgi:hypothetical protein
MPAQCATPAPIALDGRRPRPLFRDTQNLATICLKIGIMNLRARK